MTTVRDVAEAQTRARRIYPSSKGFQGAYVKGARAALAGKTAAACPYKRDPRKTWGSSWRVAWMRGHGSVNRPMPEE